MYNTWKSHFKKDILSIESNFLLKKKLNSKSVLFLFCFLGFAILFFLTAYASLDILSSLCLSSLIIIFSYNLYHHQNMKNYRAKISDILYYRSELLDLDNKIIASHNKVKYEVINYRLCKVVLKNPNGKYLVVQLSYLIKNFKINNNYIKW